MLSVGLLILRFRARGRAGEGIEYRIGARAMARLCEPELQGVEDVRRRVAVAMCMACEDYGIDVPLERVEELVIALFCVSRLKPACNGRVMSLRTPGHRLYFGPIIKVNSPAG